MLQHYPEVIQIVLWQWSTGFPLPCIFFHTSKLTIMYYNFGVISFHLLIDISTGHWQRQDDSLDELVVWLTVTIYEFGKY